MTEIINLKQKRKAKARTEKEKKASENRVKYGRTKDEKKREALKSESARRLLEGHKRETENEEK